MSEIVISTSNLHKTYVSKDIKVHALKGLNISINEGEIVGVMGPSGCGKTTLLNCLSGLDTIDDGNILIQGKSLNQLNDDQLSEFRAKRMGFVFQTYNLLPVLTAVENVELPLLVSGNSSKDARSKAIEKLKEVDLENQLHQLPGELSGGQRQRVTIARALVNDPAIVWADEPTGNLDSENEEQIMDLLIKMNKENNQTFVIVTHSDYVGGRANRIISMKDGEAVSYTHLRAHET